MPAFKLLIAVCVNIILIGLCQRLWTITKANNSRSQEMISRQNIQIKHLEQLQQQLIAQQHTYEQKLEEQLKAINNVAALAAKASTDSETRQVSDELKKTHDVAIPYDIPAWTESDTAFLETIAGFDMMGDLLKEDYNRHEEITNASEIDFVKIGRAERIHKALWKYIYPLYHSLAPEGQDREREISLQELAKTRADVDFFLRLEFRLYPWMRFHRRTSFSFYESYSGRGYVICAGNYQFQFAVASIQAIRSKLKSNLPIQVFYINHWDLTPERRAFLSEMTHDIEVVDISTILDDQIMKLGGWAIKPFAILASKFEEAMLIDSDAFFLRDPEEMFSDPGYKATGALFFYDRTLGGGWRSGPDWIRSVVPFMSNLPRTTRAFRGKSDHEQESGVVLINKKTRFAGLLSVCKLNGKYERDLWTYQKFYGDKETYWSGFEMVQEPYAFVRNYGGVIGELREDDDKSVCGAQLHLDYLGRPFWWNGGVMRNKNEGISRDLVFGYWMAGGGLQAHRERIVTDEELVADLLFNLNLSSKEEIMIDEELDPIWDFKESCLAGWTVNIMDERQLTLANSYERLDKVAKDVEQTIEAQNHSTPSSYDWENI
ncbi:hypothetical protein BGZ98_001957 [Dissophora globulifera]|nr:hypothetical protein BGZ98_001957 [Dissophora globulifera]